MSLTFLLIASQGPAASHTALPEPLKTEAFAVGRKTLSLCLVALHGGGMAEKRRAETDPVTAGPAGTSRNRFIILFF